MKLIYLLVAALLLQSSSLFSQEYVFGVKAGLNNNTIGVVQSKGTGYEVGDFEGKKDLGYQIGAFFMVEFKGFYIRPELNYVEMENHYEFPKRDAKWTTSKIEIPILFGLQIAEPVSIYVGPSLNFFDEYRLEGVQNANNFSDGGPDLAKNTASINFGIMAHYNRFSLDLRYEVGTKKLEEGNGIERANFDIDHGRYGVNLADYTPYTPKMLRLSLSIDIFRTDGTSLADLFKNDNNCGCPY